jgi:SAM-dependent methyltransferase
MNCPVCEHPDCHQRWALGDRFFGTTAENFPLYECTGCGLLFQDAAAVASRLSDFYPEGYWWRPGSGIGSRFERRYREWVVEHDHLRTIRRWFPEGNSLSMLDIGCGTGLFVSLAGREGFQAAGLESSQEAVRVAHEAGVDSVICGDENLLIDQGRQFDLITLFHVLEHVPEPFKYLRRIQKLLKKPGHLVVQVPNRASLQARLFGRRWYGLDCPRHLNNFTEYAVLAVLGRAGFRIRQVRRFSLRDNAAAMVSSLVPALDPMSSRILARADKGNAPSFQFLRGGLYFGLVQIAQPLAWLEARLGRGGTVMVHATWDI